MSDVKTLKNILLVKNVEESIRDNENIIFKIIPALECEKGFDQKNGWHHTINYLQYNFAMRVRMNHLM